jgi:acyl-CoA synthetase (NDP forming)
LAELTPETKQRLHAIFPPWDIPVNPLDTGVCTQFTAGIDVHIAFLQAMADDPNVDGVAISLPVGRLLQAEELAKGTGELIKRGKAVVTWPIDPAEARGAIAHLEANRIPVYPSAERAIRALAALYRYHKMREAMS